LLEVKNVDYYYEDTQALNQVSFSVNKGEFFGVIGPNGSGKTTLLRCISGVLEPQPGSVKLNGLDVHKLGRREIAKNIAVVPQLSNIDLDFTVYEIVMMGRNPYLGRLSIKAPADHNYVEDAMKLTNSGHLKNRPIGSLSAGELQKVIIARALAQQPVLMLLDEPTAHLDISHRLEIMELIKRLTKSKETTVVGVFHDLNLAAQYCDRTLLLDRGKIRSMGVPNEVLTPENIRKTYRINVIVKAHPITSSLYVIPLTTKIEKTAERGKRVHLICGGGSGVQLMKLLQDEGYYVTAGVLNVLDSDHEAAVSLGIPAVTEAPFSEITEEANRRNLRFILESDAVVVADMFFGKGNLKNLEAAKVALEHQIPVILTEFTPFQERNFVGKEGEQLFDYIRERAGIVKRPRDLPSEVSKTLS
jgi:iron complex transport system ATP-binding protein